MSNIRKHPTFYLIILCLLFWASVVYFLVYGWVGLLGVILSLLAMIGLILDGANN